MFELMNIASILVRIGFRTVYEYTQRIDLNSEVYSYIPEAS